MPRTGLPKGPLNTKIVWTGTVSELTYFFRTLKGKKLIKWSDEDYLWNIVASHFRVETQYKTKISKKDIDPESLSHHTEKPNDANNKKLDSIITFFDCNLFKYLQEKDHEKELEDEKNEEMARKDYIYNR